VIRIQTLQSWVTTKLYNEVYATLKQMHRLNNEMYVRPTEIIYVAESTENITMHLNKHQIFSI